LVGRIFQLHCSGVSLPKRFPRSVFNFFHLVRSVRLNHIDVTQLISVWCVFWRYRVRISIRTRFFACSVTPSVPHQHQLLVTADLIVLAWDMQCERADVTNATTVFRSRWQVEHLVQNKVLATFQASVIQTDFRPLLQRE
jgi:hypothetical protein